jgi:DNA-binding XRE family transcriptional regulator
MGKEKLVEVPVRLRESTLQYIENIVTYENKKNQLFNKNKPYATVEDFIAGCCIEIIKKLETYNEKIVHGFDIPTNYKLKNNIKKILKDKNIKQLDLAELTGLDKSTINLIVNNRTNPTLDAFLKIWSALDFPPIEEILYRVPE